MAMLLGGALLLLLRATATAAATTGGLPATVTVAAPAGSPAQLQPDSACLVLGSILNSLIPAGSLPVAGTACNAAMPLSGPIGSLVNYTISFIDITEMQDYYKALNSSQLTWVGLINAVGLGCAAEATYTDVFYGLTNTVTGTIAIQAGAAKAGVPMQLLLPGTPTTFGMPQIPCASPPPVPPPAPPSPPSPPTMVCTINAYVNKTSGDITLGNPSSIFIFYMRSQYAVNVQVLQPGFESLPNASSSSVTAIQGMVANQSQRDMLFANMVSDAVTASTLAGLFELGCGDSIYATSPNCGGSGGVYSSIPANSTLFNCFPPPPPPPIPPHPPSPPRPPPSPPSPPPPPSPPTPSPPPSPSPPSPSPPLPPSPSPSPPPSPPSPPPHPPRPPSPSPHPPPSPLPPFPPSPPPPPPPPPTTMVILLSYPLASGLVCSQLQVAMSSLFSQIGATILTPPACTLTQNHAGSAWVAQVSGTLFSPEQYAAAQSLVLTPQGMAAFLVVGGVPCLATFTVVPPTGLGSTIYASCSTQYPSLCCAPPPPPALAPPACNCTCNATFSPSAATTQELQQMQWAIAQEIATRSKKK